MIQRNIDVMDIIVSKMAEGAKLSKALKLVYNKRNVSIPYNEESFNVSIMKLEMSHRATNALMRAKLRTIGEVVEFCNNYKITTVTSLGKQSGIEVIEAVLNYCWNNLSEKERVDFLIDTVERNQDYIREGIV